MNAPVKRRPCCLTGWDSRFVAFIPSIVFGTLLAMLLNGCLFNRGTVTTRYFVLAPISTNQPAPMAIEPLAVGIGFVKMPPYLLRNSMFVRNGYEIAYLEDAQWG